MKNSLFILFILFISACSSSENKVQKTALNGEYCLSAPPEIGIWKNQMFYEGGFSGLRSRVEADTHFFYVVTDRGINIPAHNSDLADGQMIKIFPFPDYSPRIFKLFIHDGQLNVANTFVLKSFSGLPPQLDSIGINEIAKQDIVGNVLPFDSLGVDIESFDFESDSVIWFAEEYRPSLWRYSLNTGEIREELSPYMSRNESSMPSIFKQRRPNRGFEGMCIHKNKYLYAMLQSPIKLEGNSYSNLNRILRYDLQTKTWAFYIYEMSEEQGEIRAKDWKIGDMEFVNDSQLLVLEHASRNKQMEARVYLVNLDKATIITDFSFEIERFSDIVSLQKEVSEINAVHKVELLDLMNLGWKSAKGKPEGICLADSMRIAVVNDNDYGIESKNEDGIFESTGVNSCIEIFTLQKAVNIRK